MALLAYLLISNCVHFSANWFTHRSHHVWSDIL